MTFDLSDYVDVAERIRVFKAAYPDGSLQSEVRFTDHGVVCIAWAYRTPEDQRPGIGHAFEPIPGKTPYTKDSEVMNAETSAWGRAIVALGFETKKIASADEIRNRTAGDDNTTDDNDGASFPPASPAAPSRADALISAAKAAQAANKNPSGAPQDDGRPENVVITFGKHRGMTLGQVPSSYREWLIEKFEAKNAEQRRILMADQSLAGNSEPITVPLDDDIPF